jgi:mannose-6-phosphate isomerase-like protein (cupin superfamily)
VFRCSYSMGSPVQGRVRTGILDDEIQFIREGRGVWTVSGNTFEGGAGDIFVIKAGEIRSFKVVGDSPLVQFDVHLSPRFIQENL